jgi:hypothetical protein
MNLGYDWCVSKQTTERLFSSPPRNGIESQIQISNAIDFVPMPNWTDFVFGP